MLAVTVEGERAVVARLERPPEPGAQGRTLARVRPLLEDLGAGLARDAGGLVGRAVVHDEDGQVRGGPANDGRDPRRLVVGRDQRPARGVAPAGPRSSCPHASALACGGALGPAPARDASTRVDSGVRCQLELTRERADHDPSPDDPAEALAAVVALRRLAEQLERAAGRPGDRAGVDLGRRSPRRSG